MRAAMAGLARVAQRMVLGEAPEAGPAEDDATAAEAETHPASVPAESGEDLLSALPAELKARRRLKHWCRGARADASLRVEQARVLALLAPADAARLACASAAWRRDAAECWAHKLAALPRHALWPEHVAPHGAPLSLLRPARPPLPPLAAFAAAADAAFSLPATRCAVTHMGTAHRFWMPASDEAAANVAAGAISGVHAATCFYVCWFDVRTTLSLPLGAWLVRWRLRLAGAAVETFTLRCEAAAADAERVVVTPVPAALQRRGAPAGRAWAPAWRGAADDAARLRPQTSLDAAWTPRLRARPQPDWQHLPAAVVHVRPGARDSSASAAEVTVALFKHSNNWVHGIAVDCVQALPLSGDAACFGPLPALLGPPAFVEPGADEPLRREAFERLAVQPVPPERWAAPHWVTQQER